MIAARTPMLADLYILQKPRAKAEGGGLAPLASRSEIVRFFRAFNTAMDHEGADVLHGPGIRVEMPPMQDPVMQLTVTVTEPAPCPGAVHTTTVELMYSAVVLPSSPNRQLSSGLCSK